jgi:hypothetical protein
LSHCRVDVMDEAVVETVLVLEDAEREIMRWVYGGAD